MSCCYFENAKQNAQNNELHQNENKCADHKYVTDHKSCTHGPYVYIHKRVPVPQKNKKALSCLLQIC